MRIEFEPDPGYPPATPLEARVLRRAELSDELLQLDKRKTRLKFSRIIGLSVLGLFTVNLAWGVRSFFYAGISAVAWVGIAILYHRSSVRLASQMHLIQDELEAVSGSAS